MSFFEEMDINDISKGTQTNDVKVTLDGEEIAINDGGNTVTVDGTVTANLSAVDNAVLDDIAANQTDKSQHTKITDGTEEVNINASNELQVRDDDANTDLDTIAGDTTSLDSKITKADTDAVVISSGTITTITNDVNIADGGNSITVDGTITASNTAGDVAHDSADSGNPVKIGFKSVDFDSSAPPNAAAAEDDRVNAISDEYGRQYVETTHPNYWDVSADYAAAQTNTTVKAAPGAGLSLYITDVIISNGATAGNITLLDGAGGTVLLELYPAINGGLTHSFRSPIKLTANTLLAITSTTVTTHSVTIAGFTAP